MSGFLLWWWRDASAAEPTAGAPDGRFAPGVVRAAVARLTPRGPEGQRVVRTADALAIHTAFTDAVGAEDDLPLERDDLLLAADLRLDDRAQLRAHLRAAGRVLPTEATDAALCHAALRLWGTAAAQRLIGDFAFAALDRRTRSLVAARGTFGVKPLFVAETTSFVAVSNDLDALLALPGVDDQPDEQALAEFLRTGSILDPWRTARRGVRRVPPSHQWVWRGDAPRAESRHWEFPDPAPRLGGSDAEVLEEFRALLASAVVDRLRAPRATIQLSGGIDSPTIAATARRHCAHVALSALTVSHERLVADDERKWAEQVARHLAIPQRVAFLEADGLLAHCDDASLRTPEPVADPELAQWRQRARELAAEAPVTIDGEDGDALLAPPDLLTLVRSRPIGETLHAWRAYRARTGRRPWIGVREFTGRGVASRRGDWAAPRWMLPELRARYGEGMPSEPARHRLRPLAARAHQQPVWETLFAIDDPSVTGAPLTVVLPLLDARLFAFVFALPPIPWCQEKHLLRRVMEGALPPAVLSRPKTPVTGALEAGMSAWRARGGPARALAHPMDHLVDVPAWRRALEETEDPSEMLAAWRVFEVARWLAQPEAARA